MLSWDATLVKAHMSCFSNSQMRHFVDVTVLTNYSMRTYWKNPQLQNVKCVFCLQRKQLQCKNYSISQLLQNVGLLGTVTPL